MEGSDRDPAVKWQTIVNAFVNSDRLWPTAVLLGLHSRTLNHSLSALVEQLNSTGVITMTNQRVKARSELERLFHCQPATRVSALNTADVNAKRALTLRRSYRMDLNPNFGVIDRCRAGPVRTHNSCCPRDRGIRQSSRLRWAGRRAKWCKSCLLECR